MLNLNCIYCPICTVSVVKGYVFISCPPAAITSFLSLLPRADALQLPDAVTHHLHVIKDCVYAYDYNGCLQNVNAMVSGGSFAMLADFLPGIKVLVQVAMQLGIYLERQ